MERRGWAVNASSELHRLAQPGERDLLHRLFRGEPGVLAVLVREARLGGVGQRRGEGLLLDHDQRPFPDAIHAGGEGEPVPVLQGANRSGVAGLLAELALGRGLRRLARLDASGHRLPEPAPLRDALEEQDPAVGRDRHHRDGPQIGARRAPAGGRAPRPGGPPAAPPPRPPPAPARPSACSSTSRRGHPQARVGDAAGDDGLEVAQVGPDVEGEAVGGDPAGEVDADGADLAGCPTQHPRCSGWRPASTP